VEPVPLRRKNKIEKTRLFDLLYVNYIPLYELVNSFFYFALILYIFAEFNQAFLSIFTH